MARAPKSASFEIGENLLRAGWGGRMATLRFTREAQLMVVEMDAVEAWEDGEEITMPDLQRLLELVEREAEARGLDLEFE